MSEEPFASAMEMEAEDFSNTLVYFYWTTWCQVPEDIGVQKMLMFSRDVIVWITSIAPVRNNILKF